MPDKKLVPGESEVGWGWGVGGFWLSLRNGQSHSIIIQTKALIPTTVSMDIKYPIDYYRKYHHLNWDTSVTQ